MILNEQLIGGDGGEVGAIIVRAARLVITESGVFDLPRGTEIIMAHAAAGVPDVVATRAIQPGATPQPTPVPWASISAYQPVDVTISNDNGDSDNFTISTNGNIDNVAAGGGGGGGGGGGTRAAS